MYVINCFSLAAFKIISLSLSCVILIIIRLHVDLFEFTLFGTLYEFCTWLSFLFQIRECSSAIISSNKFPIPFILFSLWCSHNANIKSLMLSSDSLILSFMLKKEKSVYSFYCSDWVVSTILSSRFLMYSSLSSNLLLTPSNLFLFLIFWLLYSFLLDSFYSQSLC